MRWPMRRIAVPLASMAVLRSRVPGATLLATVAKSTVLELEIADYYSVGAALAALPTTRPVAGPMVRPVRGVSAVAAQPDLARCGLGGSSPKLASTGRGNLR